MKRRQRVIFRTDASREIGIGHLMRCVTLADELKASVCETAFVCGDLPDNLRVLVEARGHRLLDTGSMPASQRPDWRHDARQTEDCIDSQFNDVDWIVVDHYGLARQWQTRLRTRCRGLMVIDDLANRRHDCDILLDQNFYHGGARRYDNLTAPECQRLLGPRYALLRAEFRQQRQCLRERDGRVERILVFFGGGDPLNRTLVALQAINSLSQPHIHVDVVAGGLNPNQTLLAEYCRTMSNTRFHTQVENMAELFARADLAVAAGGSATWERCFLGLPSITVIFADNQRQTTLDVAEEGAILCLGWAHELKQADYAAAIRTMIAQPAKMRSMSARSQDLMGGESYLGTAAVAAALQPLRGCGR